jgi:hypothetical protein
LYFAVGIPKQSLRTWQLISGKQMEKEKILAVIDLIYQSTWRCIAYINYFEMVKENIENRRAKGLNENEFLLVIQNAIGDEACFYWSHIFGSK